MEINIYVQTKNIEFDYEKIVESVKEAFTSEFADDKLLSLILVNNEEIKEINKQYRNINKTTDVISFVDREDDYIGDIFICIDKVKEQAIKYKNSEEWEFAFLLIHGILHLSGFDHIEEEDENIMFEKQNKIIIRSKIKK